MKKLTNKDLILDFIEDICKKQSSNNSSIVGCDTIEISEQLDIKRSNVSKILNELYNEGKVLKIKGKPVLYKPNNNINTKKHTTLSIDNLIGGNRSLKNCIQQAKAAMLYPPHGLNTLLLGETGVGKTMFAELMHRFAIESDVFPVESPFISFNCADYANNPQLLLARLFGCKKGAYTGADKDKIGFVERANKGILFLDEVHRLPPEGQEMLFYLMDKGEFTPLGESENVKKSEVLIICATTENVDTSLLQTFTRRMPMSITIPPLKDRSFEERFELICEFFKIEATRIGKEIIVSQNSLRCLLLYDCSGNIGQLKSDIQLGCANAFLKCISKGEKSIYLHNTDFASYVKQGLLLYKTNIEKIDSIVICNKQLSFKSNGYEEISEIIKGNLPENFYENMQNKIEEFKEQGVKDNDINLILSTEINTYFKNFIDNFENPTNKDELLSILPIEIIDTVEDLLKVASKELNRIFPSQTFYGLCLHIDSSIKRLKSGNKIINPTLTSIVEDHKEEYALALNFASKIEKKFDINLPLDEIGFIAMFLTLGEYPYYNQDNVPIVVVAMHGKSTASSMVDFTKKLINAYNIHSYDMNIDTKTNIAYNELKKLIIENHKNAGVLLLVDMGSFKIFGDLLEEETGIKVRVIEMSSTLTVLECARKSMLEKDIDSILESVQQSQLNYFNAKVTSVKPSFNVKNKNAIITVCTTGEGSAVAIKEIIESKLDTEKNEIEIIPLNMNNISIFYSTLNKIAKEKSILAIVGTFNPEIYDIPFIPISQIFNDLELNNLNNIIKTVSLSNENKYNEVLNNCYEEVSYFLDKTSYLNFFNSLINFIKIDLSVNLNEDILIGLILHVTCNLKRIYENESEIKCLVKTKILTKYKEDFDKLKSFLEEFSKKTNLYFNDDEICFIIRTIRKI